MTNTLNPPPEVIESWPLPNYSNPETRGSGLFALTIVLIILGGGIVSARTYTRIKITRAFGLDDALILVSYLLAVVLSILIIIGNKSYYSGRHVWDVPVSTFAPHRHNIWWSELMYVLASSCAKISVLLFYRRLSLSFTKLFMWATYIGLVTNMVYLAGFVIWLCLICQPLDAYWNSFNPSWRAKNLEYHCRYETITLPLSGALSVMTDLYATLVPLFLIMTMQRSIKDKLALYFIFSAGFLVVIFGIVRTIYSYKVLNVDYDFTWILYDCWIFTQLELYLAILAASTPALRPLMHRFLDASKRQSRRLSHVVQRPAYDSKRVRSPMTGTYSSTDPPLANLSSRDLAQSPTESEGKNPFAAASEVEWQTRYNRPLSPFHENNRLESELTHHETPHQPYPSFSSDATIEALPQPVRPDDFTTHGRKIF